MKTKLTTKKAIGIILTSAYVLLMLFALFSIGTHILPTILIVAGCLLSVIYMITIRKGSYKHLIIAGMLCISVGAVVIGIQDNSTQVVHHVIRTLYAGIIVWLYLS